MPRPSKEYQAFTPLTDQLLSVSKETLDRRMTVGPQLQAGGA
jgi:hypothetical protein